MICIVCRDIQVSALYKISLFKIKKLIAYKTNHTDTNHAVNGL